MFFLVLLDTSFLIGGCLVVLSLLPGRRTEVLSLTRYLAGYESLIFGSFCLEGSKASVCVFSLSKVCIKSGLHGFVKQKIFNNTGNTMVLPRKMVIFRDAFFLGVFASPFLVHLVPLSKNSSAIGPKSLESRGEISNKKHIESKMHGFTTKPYKNQENHLF